MTPDQLAAFRESTASARQRALASAPDRISAAGERSLRFWWTREDRPQPVEPASGAA